MPRVPTYDNFQVSPNVRGGQFAPVSAPVPSGRAAGPVQAGPGLSPALAGLPGQQMQQTGEAVTRAGVTALEIQTQEQLTANQLRVDDALNQAKEAALRLTYDKEVGFTNLKGVNALDRPDGKPLADEYGDHLQKRISQISEGLGNDAQRSAFSLRANDMVVSLRGSAIAHEASEFKNYGLSVAEGVQSTAMREIGLNYNNPQVVDSAVGRIKAEAYRQGQLLGKSAEWQEAQARKLTSNAHKVALVSALEKNDPLYADAYLRKYSDQMEADDILTVRGHITREVDTRIGTSVASDAMRQVMPRMNPSEATRAFNIAVGAESGGRQFDGDGKPLTSKAGAIGIAQVMPATAPEAAKIAGLEWDENRYKTDATYNKALGFAYFQKQLQDFGGDLSKAYAAYNAGPGALKSALAAEKNPKNDTGKHWLDFLPKETQDYVVKNMKAYGAGQGQEPRPTFAEIDDGLRADPRLAASPARYKVARSEAERLFEEQTKALKQRDDEAVATAMRGIIETGGRVSDLPASVRAAVPPKEMDNLFSFAQKIAKGDDTSSMWLYNKLAGNPDTLARMSDDEFFALRRELSEADFKHFSNERAKRNGSAPGSNGPGDLNSQAIKQTLDERLRMLQIDPTPKDDGGSDAARIGGMRRFVDQYFVAAQREAGKKFTDAEVAQHIDALFAKNETFRGWFSNSSGPMLGMKAGDIPSEAKDNIKAAYKRQGVDKPTDAQLLNAYWNLKVARK
jgi:soluble lytic murein transglycosylase